MVLRPGWGAWQLGAVSSSDVLGDGGPGHLRVSVLLLPHARRNGHGGGDGVVCPFAPVRTLPCTLREMAGAERRERRRRRFSCACHHHYFRRRFHCRCRYWRRLGHRRRLCTRCRLCHRRRCQLHRRWAFADAPCCACRFRLMWQLAVRKVCSLRPRIGTIIMGRSNLLWRAARVWGTLSVGRRLAPPWCPNMWRANAPILRGVCGRALHGRVTHDRVARVARGGFLRGGGGARLGTARARVSR